MVFDLIINLSSDVMNINMMVCGKEDISAPIILMQIFIMYTAYYNKNRWDLFVRTSRYRFV